MPESTQAVAVPVEPSVRPRAWALAAAGGDYDYLRSVPSLPNNGDPPMNWEPLYDQATLDAAVAAERERCAVLCDQLDAMSRDPMVCSGSAEECAAAIRGA
jgi:hypothetical protein